MNLLTHIFLNEGFLGAFFQTIVIIFLGFYFRKKGIVDSAGKRTLTAVIWKIAVPCLAFNAFMTDFDPAAFISEVWVFLLTGLYYALAFALTALLFHRRGKETASAYGLFGAIGQLTLFSMPVLQSIYSPDSSEVLLAVSVMTPAFRVMVYAVSFFILSGTKADGKQIGSAARKILLNPIMIAMILGMLIWMTQNRMPQITIDGRSVPFARVDLTLPALYRTVSSLEKLVGPLAMFLIGMSLGESELSDAFRDRDVWIVSLIRNLAVPLCVLAITWLLQLTGIVSLSSCQLFALVIGFAAPVSATVSLTAIQYHREDVFASRISLLSVCLCLVTIPVVYGLTSLASAYFI